MNYLYKPYVIKKKNKRKLQYKRLYQYFIFFHKIYVRYYIVLLLLLLYFSFLNKCLQYLNKTSKTRNSFSCENNNIYNSIIHLTWVTIENNFTLYLPA